MVCLSELLYENNKGKGKYSVQYCDEEMEHEAAKKMAHFSFRRFIVSVGKLSRVYLAQLLIVCLPRFVLTKLLSKA